MRQSLVAQSVRRFPFAVSLWLSASCAAMSIGSTPGQADPGTQPALLNTPLAAPAPAAPPAQQVAAPAMPKAPAQVPAQANAAAQPTAKPEAAAAAPAAPATAATPAVASTPAPAVSAPAAPASPDQASSDDRIPIKVHPLAAANTGKISVVCDAGCPGGAISIVYAEKLSAVHPADSVVLATAPVGTPVATEIRKPAVCAAGCPQLASNGPFAGSYNRHAAASDGSWLTTTTNAAAPEPVAPQTNQMRGHKKFKHPIISSRVRSKAAGSGAWLSEINRRRTAASGSAGPQPQ